MPGLILGQAIGRWGNFMNREVFGDYYNGLFSMQIPLPVFFATCSAIPSPARTPIPIKSP